MPSDKNDLLSLIANALPDNNAGDITPAKIRQVLEEMVSSDVNMSESTEQFLLGSIKSLLLRNATTPNPDPAYEEGLVFWDDEVKALTYFNDDAGIKVHCGRDILVKVKNNNGSTMVKGEAVTITGADAGVPTVVRAIATTTAGARAFGLIANDIAVGAEGYIVYIGDLSGFDTSGLTVGPAYVSDTIPGALTSVAPRIPYIVGLVLTSNATAGQMAIGPSTPIPVTAIAQVSTGAAHTQALTAMPEPAEGFGNTPFAQNVTVTSTPSNGSFRASFRPETATLSGFYEVSFQLTGESASNAIVVAELYRNGAGTGLTGKCDFTQNTIDEGTVNLSAFTEVALTELDELEVYVYAENSNTNFAIDTILINIKRLGGE